MTSAVKGPMVVYGQRPPIGSGGSENPYLAPSLFAGNSGMFDMRPGYRNTWGSAVGFCGNDILCLDATPSTKAATNIAASQSPGAGAITLVSSTGAGVTVTSAAQFMPASGVTIPSGVLALDGAVAFVNYGRQLNSLSNNYGVVAYDPSTLIARTLQFVSGSNDSGITFTVKGWDIYGFPLTETITGANAGTASGAKAWKYINTITHSGSVAGTLTIGTNDVFGLPFQVLRFGRVSLCWNNGWITANTGFTAADTTSPATATTGDVRGTYGVQSASDGTKTLQSYIVSPPAALVTNNGATSLFGVSQFGS